MRRVHARAPNIQYLQQGIFAEADDAKREVMITGLMRVVARLHALDVGDLGLPMLETRGGAGQHFIDREINWALQELRARFPDHEEGERAELHTQIRRTLEETAPVLRARAPHNRKPVLAHGDVTIANTMYNDDGSVAALLDWELSHHGLPEADVAYFLSAAGGIAHMGGAVVTMPSLDQMIACYEAAGGRGQDWDFGAAFAAYRVATWGAIGMRRMPKPFWPAQLAMWEHHRDGLADAMRGLTRP
jgi:aminoglycoside phosphotransferase (APT) family kinase protein